MQVSMVTVNRVFKTYQGQARIAELNSKNPVKRVQGQRDRVSIANEARMMLQANPSGDSSPSVSQKAEARPVETAEFKPDNFEQNAE
ncbi:MAG: hypothetical protein F3739_00700 [Nitrospinae bacterium]|nr:hypothetical protein [Nitrospinota bacterium]